MKTLSRIVIALTAVIALASCSDTGKYVEHNGTICYTYWTFSFGRLYDTLPGVDPASFKAVNNWLGHDRNAAFFKDRRVDGVDVASLRARDYPVFCDKKDYYFRDCPLHVADIASFRTLHTENDHIWAADARYAYFDSTRIEVDLPSFRVKSWLHAVDRNHVYRFGKILPLADPATYDEDWQGLYSRDKSRIWYCGEILDDVDYATFTVDKDGKARDARGPFRGARRDSSSIAE